MLSMEALSDIYAAVKHVEAQCLSGILIEAGCALGGSAIVICAAKRKERQLKVYDVFGQIPAPSANDDQDVRSRYNVIVSGHAKGINGDVYYGYQDNLLERVGNNFHQYGFPVESNNVELIRGLFQDTLNIHTPVAFAHIDGDWYESVKVCIERIYPRLSQGGVIIVDDYFAWSGCRKAIDDYLLRLPVKPGMIIKKRLHIVKE